MNKAKVRKIAQKFQRKIQKIVDDSPGLDKISIEVEGKETIIAQKRSKK